MNHYAQALNKEASQTMAKALRLAAHAQPSAQSHDQQAAVIHWLLGFYFSHGNQWAERAEAELKEMHDTTKPERGE